jgi:hypothetical protein
MLFFLKIFYKKERLPDSAVGSNKGIRQQSVWTP